MILMTDWLDGRESDANLHRPFLVALDWRSPDEFIGYLARILTGDVDALHALAGGYTFAEKNWLRLVAGLMEARRRESGRGPDRFWKRPSWGPTPTPGASTWGFPELERHSAPAHGPVDSIRP